MSELSAVSDPRGAAASATRQYTYFSTTRSLCPACRRLIDAKVVFRDGKVYFLKHCPDHGPSEALICGDVDWYLDSLTYLKPGTNPRSYSVPRYTGCPDSCGLCPEHQQHTCVPIVEITDHCNLECPVCLVDNRNSSHVPFEQFVGIMDTLERCEGTLNLVNLSGGEPLLHPEIERIAEHLATRDVVMSSISTHGLELLNRPHLVPFFRDRGIVISLQFDGFQPETSRTLRGANLAESRRRILDLLILHDAPFSMTVTLVKGHNEHEVPALLECFLGTDNALSMMFQPCAYTGQGGGAFAHDPTDILTIPDVAQLIADGSQGVLARSDFLPLPCSHPSCFALTYLLKLADGRFTPVSRLFDLDEYLDVIKNNALLGMGEDNLNRIKDLIYRLWTASGQIPDQEAVLRAVKAILTGLNELGGDMSPRGFMSVTEKHIKSIFIHHFMDAHTFDLARVVKCCQHYPQTDGRLMPACVFNNLLR